MMCTAKAAEEKPSDTGKGITTMHQSNQHLELMKPTE